MRTLILIFIWASFTSVSLAAEDKPAFTGPIFDTHMHYSKTAWETYSPAAVFKKLDRANIERALVSSTPDDGTVMLAKLAPKRVISGLRPYRSNVERNGWHKNPALLTYSKKRLVPGRHRAIGEVIVNYPEDLNTSEMTTYLKIAAEQNLFLHLHTGAAVVEAVFKKNAGLRVLWAHAGFSEPAAVIGRMLDQYPNLTAELSYRAEDIMGGADLEPEWKSLLLRHASRFTVGSDTWENGRWQNYQYLIDQHRQWLGKLPRNIAEKIAFGNARVLFGKAP